MTTIYPQIAEHLKTAVPALKVIDIQDGQLEAPDEQFPLVFPLALIDTGTIDWTNNGQLSQSGDMVVTVTVALRLNHRTRQGNPDMARLVDQLAVVDKVNAALHGWGYEGLYKLTRTRTNTIKRADRIKQYEHVYRLTVKDNSAMRQLTQQPRPNPDITNQ
jgi:hypothetical protein